jgi:hypothetical protein
LLDINFVPLTFRCPPNIRASTTSTASQSPAMSTDPPTDTPSANGACYFLCLPGELRNIIYAYALHEPAGIRYSMKDGGKLLVRGQGGGAESSPDLEANQIKFTCRQLRQETRGLGIRYSNLYFDRSLDAGYFLDSFNETHYRHLQALHIAKGGISENCAYTSKLVQLCLDYPHVMVWNHSPLLD